MDENFNYETFLLISPEKFVISVNSEIKETIFKKEFIIQDYFDEINFQKLDLFLNENIFEIEKKIKNFIKKTSVIIDLDIFFPVDISIIKKNYENDINFKNLRNVLYEARDYCKKTIEKKKISHIIIQNYRFNGKDFPSLPENIECKNFSLDIKFICIPNNFIYELEKILKKYQISLSQVLSANYIRQFLSDKDGDIFLKAKDIINGHNPNEVMLINKAPRYSGFFEKFFNFFN